LYKITPGLPDFYLYYQNGVKIYQIATILGNDPKIYQMVVIGIFHMPIKYTNLFNFEDLKNLPKLWILVWKNTIWQPWITLKTDQMG
jgi:hypothetical protein